MLTARVGADPPVAQKALVQLDAATLCGLRQFRAQQLLGTRPGECPGVGCCLIAMSVTAWAGKNNYGTAPVLVGAATWF